MRSKGLRAVVGSLPDDYQFTVTADTGIVEDLASELKDFPSELNVEVMADGLGSFEGTSGLCSTGWAILRSRHRSTGQHWPA